VQRLRKEGALARRRQREPENVNAGETDFSVSLVVDSSKWLEMSLRRSFGADARTEFGRRLHDEVLRRVDPHLGCGSSDGRRPMREAFWVRVVSACKDGLALYPVLRLLEDDVQLEAAPLGRASEFRDVR
jgi:hypothetical protein